MDINTDEGNAPSDNRTVEKSTISKRADSETVHSCNSHQLSTLALGSPSTQGPVPHFSSLHFSSPFRTSRKHALPLSQHRIVPRFIFEISLASSTCSEMLWLEYPMANSEVSLCPEGIYVSQGVKQKKASCLGGHQLALKAFSELVSILLISF